MSFLQFYYTQERVANTRILFFFSSFLRVF